MWLAIWSIWFCRASTADEPLPACVWVLYTRTLKPSFTIVAAMKPLLARQSGDVSVGHEPEQSWKLI